MNCYYHSHKIIGVYNNAITAFFMNTIFSKQRMLACKENVEKQNEIWESENMGNYRLVFSEKNMHLYKQYFYLNESTIYRNNSPFNKESSNSFQKKVTLLLLIICDNNTFTIVHLTL